MITIDRIKTLLKQNWLCYLAGLLLVLSIKLYYSTADSDALAWILAPTARWVGILSGISFVNEPGVGYVNHSLRFIIAPSCSGVQFMLITIVTLLTSFVHRMRTWKKKLSWMTLSVGISYLFTIFVNGFRIVASIYLPQYLFSAGSRHGWLTPERLHTVIGTVVYFVSLIAIYFLAGYASSKLSGTVSGSMDSPAPADPAFCGRFLIPTLRKCIPPLFWYFSIILGIPILNRAYKNNGKNFVEYASLLTVICLAVVCMVCLGTAIHHYVKRHTGL